MLKQRSYIYGLLFVIVVTSIITTFAKRYLNKSEIIKQDQSVVIPVEVVKAQYSDKTNDILVTTGKTMAYETQAVKVNATGRINELDLATGSYVKKGDILAVLDTTQINYLIKLASEEYRLKEQKVNTMKQLLDKNLIKYTEYVNHNTEYLGSVDI